MVDLHPIRDATILKGLAEAELETLGAIGRMVAVDPGDRLFERAQPAESLYIVQAGQFALTVMIRAVGDDVETAIEELGPGDAFGWSSLVSPHDFVYSAYATTIGSLAVFERGRLEALLSSDTNLGFRFMSNLSELIGQRVRLLQQLWIEEVEQSMARVMYWTQQSASTHWIEAVEN